MKSWIIRISYQFTEYEMDRQLFKISRSIFLWLMLTSISRSPPLYANPKAFVLSAQRAQLQSQDGYFFLPNGVLIREFVFHISDVRTKLEAKGWRWKRKRCRKRDNTTRDRWKKEWERKGHPIRYSIEIADIFQCTDGHEHFSRQWASQHRHTYIYISVVIYSCVYAGCPRTIVSRFIYKFSYQSKIDFPFHQVFYISVFYINANGVTKIIE